MHPTQHTTVTRRRALDEVVRQMADNLQHLARLNNQVTARKLHLTPSHQPSTINHQPASAACLMLAASPMAENTLHLGIVFGLLTLGSIGAIIAWCLIIAPREQEREFQEPETDAQISVPESAIAPSCAHLVPLHHHCPYCAGTHQPLKARHA
jgi:hypothetical protein